jgi:hypothetical protein
MQMLPMKMVMALQMMQRMLEEEFIWMDSGWSLGGC